jgi:hypothetical protein
MNAKKGIEWILVCICYADSDCCHACCHATHGVPYYPHDFCHIKRITKKIPSDTQTLWFDHSAGMLLLKRRFLVREITLPHVFSI